MKFEEKESIEDSTEVVLEPEIKEDDGEETKPMLD